MEYADLQSKHGQPSVAIRAKDGIVIAYLFQESALHEGSEAFQKIQRLSQ